MTLSLPYTLANGSPADADEVMANFNAVVAAMAAIRNAQIPEDAAIDYRKLSQRYTIDEIVIPIVEYSRDEDWGTIAAATSFIAPPAAWATFVPFRVRVPTGGLAWLAEAEFYVAGRSNDAATNNGNPQLRVLVDSVVLGGSGVTINQDGAYWHAGNADPIASPLLPLNDRSVIEFQGQYTASTDRIRGVIARLTIKRSPTA